MQSLIMTSSQILLYLLLGACSKDSTTPVEPSPVVITINADKTAQTLRNFGASDAWAGQFVGNWPDQKKNAIADWLFSMDTASDGSPKGIGLTMWRYNIGAGSAQQGAESGIRDEWRRAASPLVNEQSQLVNAQNWFLSAARSRGVNQFLAFYNSPPVSLTINRKAFANNGQTNISASSYDAFAQSAIASLKKIEAASGVKFDMLSPVNEPQWDWSDGGQEGCPYSNDEIAQLARSFHKELTNAGMQTKLLLAEAGHIRYLFPNSDKANKDDQVNDFFNPASTNYIGGLSSVVPAIASHSYFSTSPSQQSILDRKKIAEQVRKFPSLEYWQSEYCILGDNGGEINGSRKDLGMTPALYIARVIQQDLVYANASAWQWWISISPYDYKDGLVYIDKGNTDGNYTDSKMLWAMGNYSRFIRPGMVRIEATSTENDLHLTAFHDRQTGKKVLVVVNPVAVEKPIKIEGETSANCITYTTSTAENLVKRAVLKKDLTAKPNSITTIIF